MTKKNPAALALAEISRKKRMRTMTAAQRSEQGKRAVAARRDRQKTGTWYGLFMLPEGYRWKGIQHAADALSELLATDSNAVIWTQDRNELKKCAEQYRDYVEVERAYDPNRLSITRKYEPNSKRQLAALNFMLSGSVQ